MPVGLELRPAYFARVILCSECYAPLLRHAHNFVLTFLRPVLLCLQYYASLLRYTHNFVLTFLQPVILCSECYASLLRYTHSFVLTFLQPVILCLEFYASLLRQSYRRGQSSCGTGGVLGWSLRRASYSLDKTSCTIPRRMSSCSGISPRSFVSTIQRSRAARIRCKIS
jgi:hypothetical protein